LTLIKLPLNESDIPNNVPELPINDIPPSCNTSSLIDEVKLPENTIVELLAVFGDFNIIYEAVTESVVLIEPVTNNVPFTSSVVLGAVFPIPTRFPELNILDSVSNEPLLNLGT
jgi:hypothetical protein